MKILILGATGMLGHKLTQRLQSKHNSFATIRQKTLDPRLLLSLHNTRIITGLSADDFSHAEAMLLEIQPDVVVNCVGVVKQLSEANDYIKSITTNALLPHKLSELCKLVGARLITMSTDCVFSGSQGNYRVDDTPDPVDLYGRTKFLGEVTGQKHCLTIRTSMIGRQLIGNHGLIEWFLSQNGQTVKGYRKAVFSGLTTLELSEVIAQIIENFPMLSGVWQVSSEPISKYDLLNLLKQAYGLSINLIADGALICDRSLNGEAFKQATGIVSPPWAVMLERMHADSKNYALPAVGKC